MLFSVHLGYFPYNPQEYTKKHWYWFFFEFLPQKDRWKHLLRNEELVKFIPGEKNELNVLSKIKFTKNMSTIIINTLIHVFCHPLTFYFFGALSWK
jgi:hypothetical protein